MKNIYRIYTKSDKNARNINTPMMGRVNYQVYCAEGQEAFIAKLNELVEQGAVINEVRYGYGSSYVNYTKYINK